jgi:hypothetical protein
MRTTILLDDQLGEQLRERARLEGKSFSAFLSEAGRRALRVDDEQKGAPFQLITFGGDGQLQGIDLDRTNELLVAEDVAIYGR